MAVVALVAAIDPQPVAGLSAQVTPLLVLSLVTPAVSVTAEAPAATVVPEDGAGTDTLTGVVPPPQPAAIRTRRRRVDRKREFTRALRELMRLSVLRVVATSTRSRLRGPLRQSFAETLRRQVLSFSHCETKNSDGLV